MQFARSAASTALGVTVAAAAIVTLAAAATLPNPASSADQATTTDAASSEADSVGLRAKTGYNFSSGNYGTTATTQIRDIPLNLIWDTGNYTFAVDVAYLEVRAPADTVLVNGVPAFTTGPNAPVVTQHGWGDIYASVTRYLLNEDKQLVNFDVMGEVKLPTSPTFGTGKADFAFQVDVSKTTGILLNSVSVGYYVPGKAAGLDLMNYWHLTVDESARLYEPLRVGATYYLGQPITNGGPSQSELTAYVDYQIAKSVKFELYYLKGFTNGSPDHGAGGYVTIYF